MRHILMIGVLMILLSVQAYSHGGPSTKSVGEHEEKHSPEDFLGVSIEIPQKIQDLASFKTEKIQSSSFGEKIPVVGKIVQDTEHTVEIYASHKGILKECFVSLGSVIAKDEVICKTEEGDIKTPSDGVIIAQFINAGEEVDTVSPVFMVADLKTLSANFDVYEKDMAKVKNGQKVLLYAAGYPNQVFEGKVTFVSPRVDEASFTIKIRVQVDNTNLMLKPGMFLRGEILIESKESHLVVPTDAVQNLDGINVVFVQDEKESFTTTKVNIQLASHKQTFVLGDLKEGDLVVSDGSFMLKSKILEDEIAGGCSH